MEEIILKAKELSKLIDSLKDSPSNGNCILLIFNEAGSEYAQGNIKGIRGDLIATIGGLSESNPLLTELLRESIF